MKRITTIAIILVMLFVSCNNTATNPEVTTAGTEVTTVGTAETTTVETTVGTDVPDGPSETPETTASELILDEAHANLPVYESPLDISDDSANVFAKIQQRYAEDGYDPKLYIVKFPEASGLALVCETFFSEGSESEILQNRVKTVYFNGYRYDKDIFMLSGTSLTMEYTEDVIAIVEQGGSMPGKGVLICKNGVNEFDPSVDYCLFPEAVNGEMTYRLMTNKGCWLGIYTGAVLQMNADDIYEITGTARVADDGIFMDEATRVTMNDLFMSEEWRQIREENDLKTFEEYKAKVQAKLDCEYFLSTIPVYEYSYEEERYLDEFDKIGAEEYAKYAAGEEFDEYYAIKFTEYPDIAIIGQVVTEPAKEQSYDKRVMNSVIRNGDRYYLAEGEYGPGFHVDIITDEFMCISMRASGIHGFVFLHDGGIEEHGGLNIGEEFWLTNLYEQEGVLNYMGYSRQYGNLQHTTSHFYVNYESPDDNLYTVGTVQLVEGKIKCVTTKSYTVSEWYATRTDLHEKSGCATVEEFVVWLEEYWENDGWEEEYIHIP